MTMRVSRKRSTKTTNVRGKHLQFEGLEARQLMAADLTASLVGGLLQVNGTPENDQIVVGRSNDDLLTVDGLNQTFDARQVSNTQVDAGAGDDTEHLEERMLLHGGSMEIAPFSSDLSSLSTCENRPVYIVMIHGFGSSHSFWTNQYLNALKSDLQRFENTDVRLRNVVWDSGSLEDVLGNLRPSLVAQASAEALRIQAWIAADPRSVNLLVVGHSRGAVFANTMLSHFSRPANVHYVQEIMLDPTASTRIHGDVYPTSVPPTVDYALRVDDGQTLNLAANLVVDGLDIPGSHRVSLAGKINEQIRITNPAVFFKDGLDYAKLAHEYTHNYTLLAVGNQSAFASTLYPLGSVILGSFQLRADGHSDSVFGCVRVGSGSAGAGGRFRMDVTVHGWTELAF